MTLDTVDILRARSVLVAAGTQPNTVLGREHPDEIALDGRYFQAIDERGEPVSPERTAKPEAVRVLARLREDGRGVSFWGDVHPSPSPATWSRPWRAPSRATPSSPVCWHATRRRARRAPRPW